MIMGIKARLYALGAGLLAIAAFFLRLKTLKYQRDTARHRADIYKAQANQGKLLRRIEKEEKATLSSRRGEIAKEIEEKKREERGEKDADFKGLDNLNNPNDF